MAPSDGEQDMEASKPESRADVSARLFAKFATRTAHASGTPLAFAMATVIIVVWAITGPMFHYSDTWQLVINTGTTIITFLMVFLIQSTQNRDGLAIQAKLDELVRALDQANDKFMGIEKLTEREVEILRKANAANGSSDTSDGALAE